MWLALDAIHDLIFTHGDGSVGRAMVRSQLNIFVQLRVPPLNADLRAARECGFAPDIEKHGVILEGRAVDDLKNLFEMVHEKQLVESVAWSSPLQEQ